LNLALKYIKIIRVCTTAVKKPAVVLFLFMAKVFERSKGIGFNKGEGIKFEEMAQGKEGDHGCEAHGGDFDGQGNKSLERGG